MLQQQHPTTTKSSTQTPSDTNPRVLQKIQTSRRAMWISVAAAAMLVPLSFVLYWNFTTTDRIYASYGNLYSSSDIAGLDVLRGSDQADPQLNDALYSFNNQAYERAIHKLTTLQSKQASAQRLHLLLGISYLKEKQPDSAIGVLTPLAQNTQFEHHLEAMWHLGMAYLYKGDKKMILETFRKLAASDSIYAPKAKEILRKLGDE
jgi:hypothetical protein